MDEIGQIMNRKVTFVVLSNESAFSSLMSGRKQSIHSTVHFVLILTVLYLTHLLIALSLVLMPVQIKIVLLGMIRNLLDAISSNLISGNAYYLILKSAFVTVIITGIAWLISFLLGGLLSYFMCYRKRLLSGLTGGNLFVSIVPGSRVDSPEPQQKIASTRPLIRLELSYFMCYRKRLLSGLTGGICFFLRSAPVPLLIL